MSIPVLIQTYDEVRRLAIAGSVVAPGDFRLKKLVPLLEQAGQMAPVFSKVGEAVNRLVESNEKTSAAALLELTTLVAAILYTQGETGCKGELTPLKTVDLGRPKTQVSARVLKPLQEALTTTGSGRLEIIRDAFERGMCQDLRLIAPALAALDDTYADIGDFAAQKILPLYGSAILPELQAAFDPKGRSGHVRRLLLMHQLDQENTRMYVRRALDEGSKEVRVAAIGCLGDSPDELPFLLEQVKAKAKEVRTAALKALGCCDSVDAAQVLCAAMTSADFALAVEPIRTSRSPVVTGVLLDAAEKQFAALLAGKERDSKKLSEQNERMCLLLECLRERDDQKTEKLLLDMFGHAESLAVVKGEPSGKDVFERLVTVMAAGPGSVQAALVAAHATLPAESLVNAFVAACRSRTPSQVFTLFGDYLTAKVNEKKKDRDPAYVKREAIIALLLQRGRQWHHAGEQDQSAVVANLDPRWLDLAVKLGRLDLVQALAMPGHAGASAWLAEVFRERIERAGDDHEIYGILDTMIKVGYPAATDAVIEFIKKSATAKSVYTYYWIGPLVARLPTAEALAKLEALVPTLPEKMADHLLDYMAGLK